ncbi:hypothetical protein QNM99_20545 [Pseudomonas sp. PCH446]
MRACLKQQELSPCRPPCKSRFAGLDRGTLRSSPLARMVGAEQAVWAAAAKLPAALGASLASAEKLSDADKKLMTELAGRPWRDSWRRPMTRCRHERHRRQPAAQDRQCRRSRIRGAHDESDGGVEHQSI